MQLRRTGTAAKHYHWDGPGSVAPRRGHDALRRVPVRI